MSRYDFRDCAECGEPIHKADGLWRHVNVNRVCKDGLRVPAPETQEAS